NGASVEGLSLRLCRQQVIPCPRRSRTGYANRLWRPSGRRHTVLKCGKPLVGRRQEIRGRVLAGQFGSAARFPVVDHFRPPRRPLRGLHGAVSEHGLLKICTLDLVIGSAALAFVATRDGTTCLDFFGDLRLRLVRTAGPDLVERLV